MSTNVGKLKGVNIQRHRDLFFDAIFCSEFNLGSDFEVGMLGFTGDVAAIVLMEFRNYEFDPDAPVSKRIAKRTGKDTGDAVLIEDGRRSSRYDIESFESMCEMVCKVSRNAIESSFLVGSIPEKWNYRVTKHAARYFVQKIFKNVIGAKNHAFGFKKKKRRYWFTPVARRKTDEVVVDASFIEPECRVERVEDRMEINLNFGSQEMTEPGIVEGVNPTVQIEEKTVEVGFFDFAEPGLVRVVRYE